MLLAAAFCSKAAVVQVKQQTVAGGRTNVLSSATAETGVDYATRTVPSLSGYIFTHWSMEPATEAATGTAIFKILSKRWPCLRT